MKKNQVKPLNNTIWVEGKIYKVSGENNNATTEPCLISPAWVYKDEDGYHVATTITPYMDKLRARYT